MILQSPSSSIVYALWLRTRAILLASAAGALIVPVIASALGPIPRAIFGMIAGIGFMSGLAVLMGFVTYGGADLSTPESVFPRHMFVLPVSTRSLVLVPMLYGPAVVAVFWVLLARGVFLPSGLRLSVIWPAAALAALVSWLQAASWSPYRRAFMRVFVTSGVILMLVAFGVAAQSYHLNPLAIVGFTLVVGVCAYPVAAAGVARARRGDGTRSRRVGAMLKSQLEAQPPMHAAFASAGRAQLWLDLRRNIWYPPAITIGMAVPVAVMQAVIRGGPPSPILPEWLPPRVLSILVLLGGPLFLVMVHAMLIGKFDMWTKAFAFPAFFTARPISTSEIVLTKLRAAGIMTLLIWAGVLPIVIAYMCFPRTYDAHQSWLTVLIHDATPGNIAAIVLGVVFLILMTWKMIVQSLWITMSGRVWMIHSLPTVVMLGMAGLGWAGYWISSDPHRRAAVLPWIGPIIYGLAIAKAVAALMALTAVGRMRLMNAAAIVRMGAIWLGAAAVFCAALLLIFVPLRHSIGMLVCVVVLFLPLVRPVMAILALHYNRHR